MMRTVLTIAGFDPSGGAGVLADIKTFGTDDNNDGGTASPLDPEVLADRVGPA